MDAFNLLPRRPKQELADASRFATRALGLGILANLGSAASRSEQLRESTVYKLRVKGRKSVLRAL